MRVRLLRVTYSIRFCVCTASESLGEELTSNYLESWEADFGLGHTGFASTTPGGALRLAPGEPPGAGQHSGPGWEHWPGSPGTWLLAALDQDQLPAPCGATGKSPPPLGFSFLIRV